ncbi:MAG: amidohydrolase family protein [Pseudomonadota bacterium]
MYDLVIRGGTVVDGLGAPPVPGDVAISGDSIAAIGSVREKGARELDATGAVVTPGFIDLHTHFDAQIGWDPQLTPASWHGVTTALMGNCGVTFAPVQSADKELLSAMMESVEDIPRQAILSGLSWQWNTYGEYLDAIELLAPAINVAGLVGHAAARYYVMGERSIDEQPTSAEIEQIAAVVGDSVRDGAIGFSTNRLKAHRMPDGRCIPGTFAEEAELVAIAKAVGRHGGMLQSVIESEPLEAELALMRKQLEASGTRLLFSAPWIPGDNGASAYQPAVDAMQRDGLAIYGTTQPRPAAFLSGLKTDVLFAMRLRGDAWRELRGLPVESRLAAISDSDFRARLVEEGKQLEAGGSMGHTLSSSQFFIPPARSFWMGTAERPWYGVDAEQSLAGLAAAAGEHPVETWLRLQLESAGEGLFHVRFVNEDLERLPAYMDADWVVPGVGDAGAHVSMIMDAGWTSFLLSYWHRDRGVFSLEKAVELLTSKQARVLGVSDRGVLQVGKKADINVIDMDRVEERQPKRVYDFPGGAPRLIQRAVGYRATLVNGAIILEDDELTGTRPGMILRNPG